MIDADRLSAATVLDPDGTSVRLGSLSEDQPAVVVRLRHFGCIFCSGHGARPRRRPGRAQTRRH
jgi:hypothetical protein